MALDLRPQGLREEVQAAKARNNLYLGSFERDIDRYTGTAWRDAHGKDDPANTIYEWISLYLPKITSANPRVRITSGRYGQVAHDRAKAVQYAVNHWSEETDFRFTGEQMGVDFALRWAVCLVTVEPRGHLVEYEDPAYWPVARRIDPREFIWDPAAKDVKTWRWCAHLVIRDKEDILREAMDEPQSGWSVQEVRGLQGGIQREWRDTDVRVPDRNEIAYWEVHVPAKQLKKSKGPGQGYNGTLYTVMDNDDDGSFVRRPRPYLGPSTGPYEIGGALIVPNDPYPLAPVVATRSQSNYLNRIKRANARAVENYKRIILAKDKKLAKLIQDGENDWVFYCDVEDVAKNVTALEIAGLTAQHLTAQEDAQNTHDRASGISDAMRGNVTGDATARENLIAYDSGEVRSSWVALKFQDFQRRVLRKVAYHFDSDEDVEYDLGPKASGKFTNEQGEPIRAPKIVGGYQKGQSRDEWTTWDYRIEAGSTSRPSEQSKMLKLGFVNETIDLLVNYGTRNPWVDWDKVIEIRAEYGEVPELQEMFDLDGMAVAGALGMIAEAQTPTGAGGGPKQFGKPPPRLASELGERYTKGYGSSGTGGAAAIRGSPSSPGGAPPGAVPPGGASSRPTPKGPAKKKAPAAAGAR